MICAEEAHAGDLSPSEIGTPESVPELHAGALLDLKLVGVDHHGQCGVDLAVMLRLGESLEGLSGCFDSVCSDEVPRRLWCKPGGDEERNRPDPLDREGDLVTPLGAIVDKTLQHASRDELSDAPAKVHVCCQIPSDSQGSDLSGVRRPCCREHTPGNVAQERPDKHDLDRWSKEDDEDEACQ